MKKKLAFLAVLMLVIAGCTTYRYEPTGEVVEEELPEEEVPEEEIPEEEAPEEEVLEEELPEEELPEEEIPEEELPEEEVPEEEIEEPILEIEGEADVVASEGDLIDLKEYVLSLVQDPDGDTLDLGFTSPFDANGQWQTGVGDAGFYSVIVTATDNKGSFVTKQLTVNVIIENEPPIIDMPDWLEFFEGDLITLEPEVTDADGDAVTLSYSGWMTADTYQTSYDDAGEYTVLITADDGKEKVEKPVQIFVNDVNREPVLVVLSGVKVEVTEGDFVEVEVEMSDPEGDELMLSYSQPLDDMGMWQTGQGDAGEHVVEITVTDGVNVVSQEVLIEVSRLNQPPRIDSLTVSPEQVILKKPGDTVTVSIDVETSDPDGDELVVIYSGFMESAQKTVSYGEPGGLKTVTVTVSDGIDEVSQDITFEMNNWPCFDCLE